MVDVNLIDQACRRCSSYFSTALSVTESTSTIADLSAFRHQREPSDSREVNGAKVPRRRTVARRVSGGNFFSLNP